MITFDATSSGAGVPLGAITFAHTCASNASILFVFVENAVLANTTGVTYAGVPMTLISNSSTGGGATIYSFYLVNPASGTNNVVVSVSAGTNGCAISVSYIGALTTGVPDNNGSQTGNTNVSSFTESLTPIADKTWIIMGVINNNIGTGSSGFSAASGCFLRNSTTIGGGLTANLAILDSNSSITPPTSTTFGVNILGTADGYTTQMISFAPSMVTVINSGFFAFM